MKYYIASKWKGKSYIKYKEGIITVLVTSCVGTTQLNTSLQKIEKKGYKLREDDEEDVSSYWMTLRRRQGI